jgi:hypothetical protein
VLVDLFAKLVERETSPESVDTEWAGLRRSARWVFRFLPVFRWVPAAILLMLGIVSSIFVGIRTLDPFIVIAAIWAMTAHYSVVDLVRRRLRGQSRRKVWLSFAGMVLALVALIAVDLWLFRSS